MGLKNKNAAVFVYLPMCLNTSAGEAITFVKKCKTLSSILYGLNLKPVDGELFKLMNQSFRTRKIFFGNIYGR